MKKPEISIVIALAPWREAEILSSIAKQKYQKNKFEVIIRKGLNVPDNRNSGVAKAKGEIIAFLDDDAIIDPDYLSNLDNFFKEHPQVDIVGGPQLTPKNDGFFAKVSGYVLEDPFGSPMVNKRYKKTALTLDADHNHITGANFSCRKSVFKKIEFNRNIYPADDVNFIKRAKDVQLKVAYSPEIYVYHRRRATLPALAKQIYDYGRAKPQRELVKELLHKPLFLVPAVFLLYLASLPLLSLLSKLFLLPIALYVVLTLLFSFYESIKNKNLISIPLLPFIFFTVHFSYGLGFITGIIQRIMRGWWNDA